MAPVEINGKRALLTETSEGHARLRKAINPAFKLAFGTTANCLNQADQPHLQVLGNRAKSVVFFQFALQYGLMSVLQFLTPKYAREARRKHLALSAAKVQARLQAKNPGKDFMYYILENQEVKFSSLDLTLLASTFIVAGSNTTADTMTGLTYLLLRNPDKMARLKHEILSMFRSKDEITMQSTVHCRRPMEFVPERWLGLSPDSEFAGDDKGGSQPFSYGLRSCAGKVLAWAELRITMAKLLWHFDFELASPADDWWNKQRTYLIWERLPLMVTLNPRTTLAEPIK
ncbi:hypothetical protein KVR01_003596 [Diaporthe batatas]|uniref:uncharacterized protein n=1 Tax=Diaporthe batatas TaxID=748121 RepID=UPI001D04CD42|nr:uncharacterized protein KVR01_003596 [Diaporthe batatas]KAG8167907.1 hypothetical protein KVR01_003596 [Diaporthe batatas]